MPIYDYACRSCGRRVEVIHGINDPGPGACDVCGGVMAKVLSAPAIVFRGTGWAKKERATAASKADSGGDEDKAPAASQGSSSADGKSSADSRSGADGSAAKPGTKSPAPEKAGSSSSKPAQGSTRSGDAG